MSKIVDSKVNKVDQDPDTKQNQVDLIYKFYESIYNLLNSNFDVVSKSVNKFIILIFYNNYIWKYLLFFRLLFIQLNILSILSTILMSINSGKSILQTNLLFKTYPIQKEE
jgi:hypothetical protein